MIFCCSPSGGQLKKKEKCKSRVFPAFVLDEPKTRLQSYFDMAKELHEIISNPGIMGGTAVFRGTRVPFEGLVEYLEAGKTIDEFVLDFTTVSRAQAVRALEEAFHTAEQLACENPA